MPKSIGLPDALTFRDLLDRLPVAAYSCDTEGVITYFNTHAVALWGREPRANDPRDRFCGSMKLFTSDGQPIRHDTCWMARALFEGRRFDNREIVIERTDGTRRTVLANATPFRDATGKVIGAVNVLMDITERKEFETALIKAKSALQAANRAKTEFLASVSHELRTPLNAILGFAEGLQGGHFGSIEGQQADYLGHIVTAGQLLHKLVDDVLDISRIEVGALSLNEEMVDLRDLIEGSVDLLRLEADDAGIELVADLPQPPVPFRADPLRMEQILVNLISNAVKFSDPGGEVSVRMHVDSEARGAVAIDIQDFGRGMRDEDIERALQPFQRIEASTRRQREGVGLGLPLALRLIELHGGTLGIDSKPEVGTTMHVRLPRHRRAGRQAIT